jgi:hypothetical protein
VLRPRRVAARVRRVMVARGRWLAAAPSPQRAARAAPCRHACPRRAILQPTAQAGLPPLVAPRRRARVERGRGSSRPALRARSLAPQPTRDGRIVSHVTPSRARSPREGSIGTARAGAAGRVLLCYWLRCAAGPVVTPTPPHLRRRPPRPAGRSRLPFAAPPCMCPRGRAGSSELAHC